LRIHIVDGFQGLPELLVFGAYRRHLNAVKRSNRSLLNSQFRMSHIRGLSQALMTLLSGFAFWAALYMAVMLVNRDALDGPGMALVALAVLASFETVWPLPAAFQYLGHTREAARRLLEIVYSKPQVVFAEQSSGRPQHFGVEFERVYFRYHKDSAWALRNVDFKISPSSRVGIIGETGSGKSSLIHLLVRFGDPDSGCVRLGGVDIRKFVETDLRDYTAVVTQQPHMFNTTLKENLLIARPDANDGELMDALEAAQLLDFVKTLPDGLDTWIGEAAILLSGGQARRLAVTRAILRDAPLWALDEPTEGLDPATGAKMMAAIRNRTVDRTLLLTTHRLNDLHWMDCIIMMENGRIVAQGAHEELIRSNTLYASMCMRIP
jgi:ATP-binding cassette subfamily C protein CydC